MLETPLALTIASPPLVSLLDGMAGLSPGAAGVALVETWRAILVPFVIAAFFAAVPAVRFSRWWARVKWH